MKRMMLSLLACALLVACSGCASVLVNNHYRTKAAQFRVTEDGTVLAGVDLTSLDVIIQHPMATLGAAVLDAGLAYGVYLAGDKIVDNMRDDAQDDGQLATTINNNGTLIINQGSGNSGSVDQHSTQEFAQ